jgi:hypothetical protein
VKRAFIAMSVIVIGLMSVGASPRSAEAATCTYVLGFKTLHDLIPATVGGCLVDEHHNAINGDGLQETTGPTGAGGLLVWRKADNWTAYTDGYRTWINGPYGLQERLNTGPLFPWEAPTTFTLGIRLDQGDSDTLAAWNAHSRSTDAEHSAGANGALLRSAKGTDRSVTCGGAAVAADSCQTAINYAVAAGIPDLNVNDEGPDCPQLMTDEATVFGKARAAGLTMTWTPIGTKLRSCAPNDFTSNTDRIIFQVEALEQDSQYNFAQTVHAEIAALHAVRPDLPIAVQVSVNPPHNRLATAAQTLADIAALEDGSAEAPRRIDVFYYARTRDPSRADVMLDVIAALRP